MDRIVTMDGVRGGRPVVAGSRITVAEVLEMFGAGMTEGDNRRGVSKPLHRGHPRGVGLRGPRNLLLMGERVVELR
jgi:hypothetical protein